MIKFLRTNIFLFDARRLGANKNRYSQSCFISLQYSRHEIPRIDAINESTIMAHHKLEFFSSLTVPQMCEEKRPLSRSGSGVSGFTTGKLQKHAYASLLLRSNIVVHEGPHLDGLEVKVFQYCQGDFKMGMKIYFPFFPSSQCPATILICSPLFRLPRAHLSITLRKILSN